MPVAGVLVLVCASVASMVAAAATNQGQPLRCDATIVRALALPKSQDVHSNLVDLAAAEIRRYMYVATGCVPSSHNNTNGITLDIVVGTTKAVALAFGPDHESLGMVSAKDGAHAVFSHGDGPNRVVVTGTTPQAVLFGAYTMIERALGARFYLHGDVVPRDNSGWNANQARLNISMSPSFVLRGIQPFHDFTCGPDWWTREDYKAIETQLVKMKMNFIGLHSYPTREPLLWVGNKSHLDDNGKVLPGPGAYPTSWRTTNDSGWGLNPRDTSSYVVGASLAFPRECYGSEVQADFCVPSTQDEKAAIFNNAADMFADAFTFAHQLGITRAIGTEVPLTKPKPMTSSEQVFEGAFERIMKTIPIDIYWHWTPEGWEWGSNGVNSTATAQAVADIEAAATAHRNLNASFELATCGWSIGPSDDPSYFDTIFDNTTITAISAIDMHLGWDKVQPQYANISKHRKWLIPWMEDDPGLIGMEMWANRTLAQAASARQYGIEGFMGIHWRTLETSLTVRAMAEVAWNESLVVDDLYLDFCNAAFGPEVGTKAAAIMLTMDSFQEGFGPDDPGDTPCWGRCKAKLPRPGFGCCGKYTPQNLINESTIALEYSFADKFWALRSQVVGADQLANFDQWAWQMKYHRGIAEVQLASYRLTQTLDAIMKLPPAQQIIAAKTQGISSLANLSRTYEVMLTALLEATNTQGELGLITMQEGMNFETLVGVPMAQLKNIIIPPPPPEPYTNETAFVGCYRDSVPRAMRYGPCAVSVGNTGYNITTCAAACAEYVYLGLQYIGCCFCDNNLTHVEEYGTAPVPCQSKDGKNWPGFVNAVYQHKATPVPPPTPPVIPSSALPQMSYMGTDRLFVLTVRTVVLSSEINLPLTAILLTASALPPSISVTVGTLFGEGANETVQLAQTSAGRGWYEGVIPMKSGGVQYSVVAQVGSNTLTYPAQGYVTVNIMP